MQPIKTRVVANPKICITKLYNHIKLFLLFILKRIETVLTHLPFILIVAIILRSLNAKDIVTKHSKREHMRTIAAITPFNIENESALTARIIATICQTKVAKNKTEKK